MAPVASIASALAIGCCAVALHDAKQVREREPMLACSSCSSRSTWWAKQRGQWFNGKLNRVRGIRVRRDFGGFYASTSLNENLEDPVCVIRGVIGPSCKGTDSGESVANDEPPTKVDLPRKKNASVLKKIIQEIDPLDISLISKDVSLDSTDAMKRTISGMLGLLPSDQFQVIIVSPREPLARLLVSSMMTGYTLRNGEYRLCLKRSLELGEESLEERCEKGLVEEHSLEMNWGIGDDLEKHSDEDINSLLAKGSFEVTGRPEHVKFPEELGAVSPEVSKYIQQLHATLETISRELEDCKHALTTLEMESLAGEETNDLLEYLRSLEPEKVAELSQPTSLEVEHVINEVIDGLLASQYLDQSPIGPSFRDGMGTINKTLEGKETSDVLGSVPLQFESNITASRDYLARLLFWCMLLGHYMCAVEHRLELSRTLCLSGELVLGADTNRCS